MSMNNKQRWMGGVVLLGGGVLLAALLLKGQEEIHQNNVKTPSQAEQVQHKNANQAEMVQLQPLTVDVQTEQRLLEEQRRPRQGRHRRDQRGQAGDEGADRPGRRAAGDLVAEPACVGDLGDKRHLRSMIECCHADHLPRRWLWAETTTNANLGA